MFQERRRVMTNERIPKHVAFIMDGNRRWAREHKLAILMGHNKGAEQIENIVTYGADKGIKYVTFWAFSTENWKRSEEEVSHLMEVFRTILLGPMVKRLIKKGVRLQIIGDYQAFSKDIVEGLDKLIEESKNNDLITATIALNYGGRPEIIRAVNRLLKENVSEINEAEFSKYLYTFEQPDPDLIIRTGGEQRLSGYLPWQGVYSELYFTDTYWPEFDETAFQTALDEYTHRERRFGK
jgi:undecaprenyl diphosphate synthase